LHALLRILADLVSAPTPKMPSPATGSDEVLWNTPELLRVDAKLSLWPDSPSAMTAAEAKLLRALEIARGQSALSWELRCAMGLAQLWWREGRGADGRDLLAVAYGKFREGFGTGDLVRARSLIAAIELDRSSE
jgi:predicted ATPase